MKEGTKNSLKRIWRAILNKYYRYEIKIVNDPIRLKRAIGLFTKLPICSHKVFCMNFDGKGYGGCPKYIAEELKNRGNRIRIYWLVNDTSIEFPQGIKPVYKHSLRAFYESATSKVWIFNIRNGKLTPKRKRQVYLQTWHGFLGVKRVEGDAEDLLSSNYLTTAKEDGHQSDGILTDSTRREALYKRSFWLSPNCEYIRIENLEVKSLLERSKDKKIIDQIKEQQGISKTAHVILYAPTFRDKESKIYIKDFTNIVKAFSRDETVVLVRLHPNEAKKAKELYPNRESGIINVTDYPDIIDLLLVSDALITDYSSVAFEMAALEKPVFLYAPDHDEYAKERGFNDLGERPPFGYNYSEEMLIDQIRSFSPSEYKNRLNAFWDTIGLYHTADSEKVIVEWLHRKGLKG